MNVADDEIMANSLPHMDEPKPVLFTQTGCVDGRKVHALLTNRNVAFVERNVTGDETAVKELIATGTFGTPLFVVGDTQVIGFRPDTLAVLLSGTDAPLQ